MSSKVPTLLRLSRTIHKARWDRLQQGMTIKEIAHMDHVGEDAITNSIRLIEIYRISCSPPEGEMRQAETVMALSNYDEEALKRALTAMRPVFDSKGRKIGQTPDFVTRLEASREYTKRIELVIGKRDASRGAAAPPNINVQNNIGLLNGAVITFEDRLREIQQRRALASPLEEAPVTDAPDLSASPSEEAPEMDALADAFSEERQVP